MSVKSLTILERNELRDYLKQIRNVGADLQHLGRAPSATIDRADIAALGDDIKILSRNLAGALGVEL